MFEAPPTLAPDQPQPASSTNTAERTYTVDVDGVTFELKTGKLAPQAGGAVTVQVGETLVLATATGSQQPREGIDFFPLSVDLEERLYAAGRIPGSFFRREGRPSEAAILAARLIDRPLRPLFPRAFRNDVQIIITALSSDGQNLLDIPSLVGASAALMISDVPFTEPVGAIRVGLIEGRLVMNPTADEMAQSRLDLRLAGTRDAILMVECGAAGVDEDQMIEAITAGHRAMQPLIEVQERMRAEVGKAKREFDADEPPPELRQRVREVVGGRIDQALADSATKEDRTAALDALRAEWTALFADDETVAARYVQATFDEYLKERVRRRILDQGVRPDGRGPEELRSLYTEVTVSPRAHGSGLFQRGETQVLSMTTLGTLGEEQRLDSLRPEETKRFMHHYNFPPFSTGETWPLRGPRRREIGHGALAETALRAVMPGEADFPYTVRLVSEVLASNGSTSMASVCASSLSLMDAGVPIAAPVAGIAMGLIVDPDDPARHTVLTDIQGMEDALGDMDFKVAGTAAGVTALQMDMKIRGLSEAVMRRALDQARQARLAILDHMGATLAAPRPELSRYAPRIITIKIDPELIGKLIGPGGKNIRALEAETGAKIDIQNDGTVHIAAVEGSAGEAALERVKALTTGPELGTIYSGKVVRITDFGAFVEILPGTDGLVHISQLSDERVESVQSVVQIGDEILVMVTDVADGKVRLSRQAVLEGWSLEEARERDVGVSRGRSRGPDRGRGGDRGSYRGSRGR
jgi:polyribonucleotide nucleotidyltransferase